MPAGALAQDIALLGHRATYELRLQGRATGSGIDSAHGFLAVEIRETCGSWDVAQAISLMVARQESQVTTSSQFESREAKDGGWYRFEDRSRLDPGGLEVSSGQASASPDTAGHVRVDEPAVEEAVLPAGTLFPTAHLVSLLRRALAGERLTNDLLFDGTEGTVIYDVSTLVGPVATDSASGLRVWPMRLAFFIHGGGAELPELEISVRLREDGVAEELSYDYGSFVLGAALQSLEPLPPPDC